MKKLNFISILLISIVFSSYAQDETYHTEAAEDFDLMAVMEVMKDSKDLEDFEKKINSKDNEVNNLDLNKDDEVDFVKVVEYSEESTKLIVLQAIVSASEVQDIATIEIEKHSDDEISLQVIGDPDIYGPDYILEPAEEDNSTKNIAPTVYNETYLEKSGTTDFSAEFLEASYSPYFAVFVSVHLWRPIRPLFVVGRIAFVSSVGWRVYPAWFIVWRPIARSTWRYRTRRYRTARYRTTRARHSARARNMYSTRRRSSTVARNNAGRKNTATKATRTSNNRTTQQRKSTQSANTRNTNSNNRANTSNRSSNQNRSSTQNRANSQKRSSTQNRSSSRSRSSSPTRGRRW